MVKLFLDISEIRHQFLATRDLHTGATGYLTVRDFRAWLFKSINWYNLIYTDFSLEMGNDEMEFRGVTANYDGFTELYAALKSSLEHPYLEDKTTVSSRGFIYGDILYFELETIDNNGN